MRIINVPSLTIASLTFLLIVASQSLWHNKPLINFAGYGNQQELYSSRDGLKHINDQSTEDRSYISSILRADVDPSACSNAERIGTEGDGGWHICTDDIPFKNCVVYSGGTRDNPSFDIAMAKRGCEVHAFDPSLSQMAHQGFHIHDNFVSRLRKQGVFFHDYGFGGADVTYPPGTAPWAWPGIGYGRESNDRTWTLKTLESTAMELGHSKNGISILKMDIEGAEWDVLERILSDSSSRERLRTGKFVRQMAIEIHFMPTFNEKADQASSERHNRNKIEVQAFNEHAANIIAQLGELGFVAWKHSLNDNVKIETASASLAACCHEISMVWRP